MEEFAPGQSFASGRLKVDRERIKSFAAEFDPQPFHLDEEAARGSVFEGLAASGWHTAAMTMRLLVESELGPAGGIVGVGFDEFRWPNPVRPDDTLHLDIEVLEVRPSKSRPDQGVIKVRTTTLNQNDEPVQVSVGNLIVRRRPASTGLKNHIRRAPTAPHDPAQASLSGGLHLADRGGFRKGCARSACSRSK
jgi:acyl dehydratase